MTRSLCAWGLMGGGAVAALVAASGPIDASASLQVGYALALASIVFGTLMRRSSGRASVGTGEGKAAAVLPLGSLQTLAQAIEGVWSDPACQADADRLNDRLGSETTPPLREFLGHRQAMLDSLGVAVFADLMIRVAKVERLLNRAASASSDGAIEEAIGRLGEARGACAKCLESSAFKRWSPNADAPSPDNDLGTS